MLMRVGDVTPLLPPRHTPVTSLRHTSLRHMPHAPHGYYCHMLTATLLAMFAVLSKAADTPALHATC
jgi:hypothetical protein